jgi:hypothetical protein
MASPIAKPSSRGEINFGSDKIIASFYNHIIYYDYKKCNIFVVVFMGRGWYTISCKSIFVQHRRVQWIELFVISAAQPTMRLPSSARFAAQSHPIREELFPSSGLRNPLWRATAKGGALP